MKSNKPIETLLCIDAQWVKEYLKEGFSQFTEAQFASLFPSERIWLGPRPVLEEKTARFCQFVVYCLLTAGDKILVFRREVSSESRLKGFSAIGLGGHVNASDIVALNGTINLKETITRAVHRELSEEIDWIGSPIEIKPQWLGCLRDDSTEVSTVHLGVVFVCDVGDQVPTLRLYEGASVFEPMSCIRNYLHQMESWSSLLIENWPRLSHVQNPSIENL